MNHRAQADSVRIRWTLTWESAGGLRDVTPLGFDASHGRQGLVYDVAGGRPAGSRDVRTATQTVPFDARIVAGLGHVHGGAIGLRLTEPACGDRMLSSPSRRGGWRRIRSTTCARCCTSRGRST